MSEEFEDREITELIEKFENCLSLREGCFFDSYEFVDIIEYYISMDNYKKIKIAINTAISLYPDDLDLIIYNSDLIAQEENPQNAIKYLESYSDKMPDEYDLNISLLHLYSLVGESEKVIAKCNYIISQDDEDTDVYIMLADEYIKKENYEKAINIYKNLLEKEPNNVLILRNLSYNSQFIEDPRSSIAFLKELCKKNPYSEENWIAYGLLLFYTENNDDAITAFDLALAINDKNAISYFYKCQSLFALENYEDIINTIHEAMKILPNDEDFSFLIAQAYEKKESWTIASTYYKECLKYDDNYVEAYIGLATCYFELNDFNSAEQYIKQAIKLDSENVLFKLIYAEMCYKQGYVEKSEDMYRNLYEEEEDIAVIAISWAYNMASTNKLMDAIHLLKETIDNYDIYHPAIYFALFELASEESYLKDHLEDYIFSMFLDYDITLDMLKDNSPSLLENPKYKEIINTYINEKS